MFNVVNRWIMTHVLECSRTLVYEISLVHVFNIVYVIIYIVHK